MEKITKIIGLETLKNRHNSKHWSYYGNKISNEQVNWGLIPTDMVIEKKSLMYNLKNTLPLTIGMYSSSGNSYTYSLEPDTLTYNNMLKWLSFLNEYNRTTTFFKKCKNKTINENEWIEVSNSYSLFDYDETIKYYNDIQQVGEDTKIGDVVGINDSAHTFNNTFRVGDNILYEKVFMSFVNDVFNGSYNNINIPYINIPLYIESDIDSNGQFSQYSKLWDQKSIYRLGDIVIWADKQGNYDSYILERGNGIEMVEVFGELYSVIDKDKQYYEKVHEITEKEEYDSNDVYQMTEDGKIKRIVIEKETNGVKKYFMPVITFRSKYNEENNVFDFDDDKNTHWFKINNDENDNNTYISTKAESRLNSVRRVKYSVDENGETLPFIVNFKANNDTELVFKCGTTTLSFMDYAIYSDVLNSIIIKNEDNSEGIKIEYKSGNTFYIEKWFSISKGKRDEETINLSNEVLKKNKVLENNEFNTVYYTGETGINYVDTSFMNYSDSDFIKNAGTIEFIYTIGAQIKNDEEVTNKNIEIIEGSGIKYKDTYKYEIINKGFNYIPNNNDKTTLSNIILVEIDDELLDEAQFTEVESIDDIEYEIENINSTYLVKNVGYFRLLYNFTYYDIKYSENNIVIEIDDNGLSKITRLSDITYGGEQLTNDRFISSPAYKDDKINGIENIQKEIDIEVDRGAYASFERHHILSEIKTFEDIENYRNNFFGL